MNQVAKEALAVLQTGTLYRAWKFFNPKEAAKFEAYVLEKNVSAPVLVTATGRALVMLANGETYDDGTYDG